MKIEDMKNIGDVIAGLTKLPRNPDPTHDDEAVGDFIEEIIKRNPELRLYLETEDQRHLREDDEIPL